MWRWRMLWPSAGSGEDEMGAAGGGGIDGVLMDLLYHKHAAGVNGYRAQAAILNVASNVRGIEALAGFRTPNKPK